MISHEITNLLITGASIGGVGTILYQLKAAPKLLYTKIKQRLIFTVRIYQYDELFLMLERWLSIHYQKQYRDVEAVINNNNESPYPIEQSEKKVLSYKQEDNTFIFKYRNKKLLITKAKDKIEKAQNLREIFFRRYLISGINAKSTIDLLLKEVIEFDEKNKAKNSIKVSSNTSYGEWYSGTDIKVKPLDKTIINRSKKDLIIEDLNKFSSSEEWYREVCIPYKRGYCFYGEPGTGKTTFALSIANYTNRNVYCLNLNAIEDDSKLPQCFQSIPNNSILLIEDIDKVFSGRDNVKETSKITFSSLLNCLDGAFYKHGLITIITTNHIEKLDEALIRTGRIDIKMEITKPTSKEINEYYEIFFKIPLDIQGNFDLKMSDVQEICIKNMDCANVAKKELIEKIL